MNATPDQAVRIGMNSLVSSSSSCAGSRPFASLLVHVLTYPDVDPSQRQGLLSVLETHGARLARARLSREVTHVIVQRTHTGGAATTAGDAALRNAFDRVQAQGGSAHIVSTAWVHKCLESRLLISVRHQFFACARMRHTWPLGVPLAAGEHMGRQLDSNTQKTVHTRRLPLPQERPFLLERPAEPVLQPGWSPATTAGVPDALPAGPSPLLLSSH